VQEVEKEIHRPIVIVHDDGDGGLMQAMLFVWHRRNNKGEHQKTRCSIETTVWFQLVWFRYAGGLRLFQRISLVEFVGIKSELARTMTHAASRGLFGTELERGDILTNLSRSSCF
jgi:hypothetical protein